MNYSRRGKARNVSVDLKVLCLVKANMSFHYNSAQIFKIWNHRV